ncbi:hypothetical protein F4680DRAFT_450600 [Xylaria scruposa]|nr:hypothetical protein F4680DRAFT_450600 [Xylaria scruposa]
MSQQQRDPRARTTLQDYLKDCHSILYQSLTIAPEAECSKGGNTTIDDKWYPMFLEKWTDWPGHQAGYFSQLTAAFGDQKLFPSSEYTSYLKDELQLHTPIKNEDDVEEYEKRGVAGVVMLILMEFLEADPQKAQQYNFTNVNFRRGTLTRLRTTNSDGSTDPRGIIPDFKAWSTRRSNGDMLAFVCDYKAAHKIDVDSLESVADNRTLFMELLNLHRSNKSLTDHDLNKKEKKQRNIAEAFIQVYNYMIVEGVQYGYLAAGKALVFLYVDLESHSDDAMKTLYYHICIPEKDVPVHGPSHTSVAQLATFYLHALLSDALTHNRLDIHRHKVEVALQPWPKHYEGWDKYIKLLENLQSTQPGSQKTQGSELGSLYEDESDDGPDPLPEPDGSDDEPIVQKIKDKLKGKQRCVPDGPDGPKNHNDENDGDGDNDRSRTPTGLLWNTSGKEQKQSSTNHQDRPVNSNSGPSRSYCTQACLLSLMQGWDLDQDCPNVSLHHTATSGTRHPIQFDQFTCLVEEQLRQNLFQYCIALDHYGRSGKTGATGTLFKVELAPYGYTFVGKGTLRQIHFDRLQHESQVYSRLKKFQGWVIPVHLGIVNLPEPWGYSLPGGYQVLHLLLMSWAGENISNMLNYTEDLNDLKDKFWKEGVVHGDVRGPNVLWNQERKSIMLIDFDRAVLQQPLRHNQVTKLIKPTKRKGSNVLERPSRKRARNSETTRVLNPDGKADVCAKVPMSTRRRAQRADQR